MQTPKSTVHLTRLTSVLHLLPLLLHTLRYNDAHEPIKAYATKPSLGSSRTCTFIFGCSPCYQAQSFIVFTLNKIVIQFLPNYLPILSRYYSGLKSSMTYLILSYTFHSSHRCHGFPCCSAPVPQTPYVRLLRVPRRTRTRTRGPPPA